MYKLLRKQEILYPLLAFLALLIPFLTVEVSFIITIVIIVGILGVATTLAIFKDFRIGVYVLILYGSLLFFMGRLFQVILPYGVPFDIIIFLCFFSILLQNGREKAFQWKTNEPITIIIIVYWFYILLQIANPNSVNIGAWLYSARDIFTLVLFYVLIHYFNSKKTIAHFLDFWVLLGFLIAVYGLKQEFFGFTDFEWQYIRAVPHRYQLFFVWGHMRIFSILSDPATFGLFVTYISLLAILLALSPTSNYKRLWYLFAAAVMLVSMSYSGTRTAYAMMIAGFVLYIIANLRNKRILLASSFFVLIFLVLMYGPFYSGPILRMRSTFKIEEDASMNVRDAKRIRLQKYVKANPLGGGINTAGNDGLMHSRGHPLAGRYDPDSGYLRQALETGWIGLFIVMALFGTTVVTGLKHYYFLHDKNLKHYAIIFIIPFFSLSIAHFTQEAMDQKPVSILIYATYAIVIKLKDIDRDLLKE